MCLKDLKQMNMRSKIINLISFATLGAAFLIIITFLYWQIFPYHPMTINTRPLPILNKVVKQGEIFYYTLDYCKSTELPVTISRRFVDGIIYSMPDVTANNALGCRVQNIGIEIPTGLPEGEYIISITYSYQVNPIRKVEVKTHTEKFTVIK